MSINESLGKHEDVTVANLNKTAEALNILTEDARKELDRMHAIFENSFISKDNIGNHGNPEGKGSATGANTKKNNDPFTETASASLDKDPGFKGTVEKATDDHNKPADPDNKLQHADKMEKGKRGDEDYKDVHDDLDGEGVADKNPKGAKAVKMNESVFEDEVDMDALGAEEPEFNPDDFHADDINAHADAMDNVDADIFGDNATPEELPAGDEGFGDPFNGEDKGDDYWADYDKAQAELANEPEDDGLVGLEEEIDSLLEEFLGDEASADEPLEEECDGKEAILKGEPCTLAGDAGKGDNNVHGEETMDKTPLQEDEDNHEPEGAGEKESKITGPDAVMDSEEGAGSGDNNVHGEKTMDRLKESIDRIVEGVVRELKPQPKKKETLEEAISRIVAEEVTKLDAWGKHPRYQKPAFKTPANKEVLAGTAKGDWNDDSTKGEQPYGQKIGDGKPFDKVVDMLTDQVLANLKESLRLGK